MLNLVLRVSMLICSHLRSEQVKGAIRLKVNLAVYIVLWLHICRAYFRISAYYCRQLKCLVSNNRKVFEFDGAAGRMVELSPNFGAPP
jgi:hypothetical protein